MNTYAKNIERDTIANKDYRRVVFTGKHTQLVLMSLEPRQEIGAETHRGHDQFIRVEAGRGIVTISGTDHRVKDGSAVIIPAGARHNVRNTSTSEALKLYTLYSPPEHPDGACDDALRPCSAARTTVASGPIEPTRPSC